MNTTIIKVGQMPGEIREYAVEAGSTVADVLKLAGIEVTAEQSIKADGETVSPTDSVAGVTTLLVTKRLKGAVA